MAKILNIGQDFVEGHIVETLHKLDDKLDAAYGAVQTANDALSVGQQAASDAADAQATANSALAGANIANSRLAGDQDYFEGTGAFTGTPSNLIVSSITPIEAVGINYTAGYFNFSYLGKYLVVITQGGDCVNTRSDWYQEVEIGIKEVVGGQIVPITFKSIPPNGTFSMKDTRANIINVVGGNQWKPIINMVALGSTTNGSFRIKIKKLV